MKRLAIGILFSLAIGVSLSVNQALGAVLSGGTALRVQNGDPGVPRLASAPFGESVSVSVSAPDTPPEPGVLATSSASGLSILNGDHRGGVTRLAVSQSTPFSANVMASGEVVIQFSPDAPGTFFASGAKFDNPFGSHLNVWAGSRIADTNNQYWLIDYQGTFDNLATTSFPYEPGLEYLVRLGSDINFSGGWRPTSNAAIWNWSLDALPGSTPDNPLLPINTTGPTFDIPIGGGGTGDPIYIDPVVAVGYDYASTAINFASVLIPRPLPQGDDLFEIIVLDQAYPLQAGVEFDLTLLAPEGVQAFGIRGIDPREAIDPADALGFVTGLRFVSNGATNVLMTPVSNVPEPSAGVLFAVALLGAAFSRRRKRPTIARR